MKEKVPVDEKLLFPKKSHQDETLGSEIKDLRLWNKGVKLVPVTSCNVFLFSCGKWRFPNITAWIQAPYWIFVQLLSEKSLAVTHHLPPMDSGETEQAIQA